MYSIVLYFLALRFHVSTELHSTVLPVVDYKQTRLRYYLRLYSDDVSLSRASTGTAVRYSACRRDRASGGVVARRSSVGSSDVARPAAPVTELVRPETVRPPGPATPPRHTSQYARIIRRAGQRGEDWPINPRQRLLRKHQLAGLAARHPLVAWAERGYSPNPVTKSLSNATAAAAKPQI